MQLEEIVVTATKRSVDMQDVALSVTALGKEQLEKRGFTEMGDYLAQTPSVTIQDRGPGRNQFVIRGVRLGLAFGGVVSTGSASLCSL